MRKSILAVLSAGAMALMGSATAANAASLVTSPATLVPPASSFFGNVVNGAGNFSDTFTFNLIGAPATADSQVSTILGTNGTQNISFMATQDCPNCGIWLDVMDAAHQYVLTQSDPDPESWALTSSLLTTNGEHTIYVNGTLNGPNGSYSGTLNVNPAVPEPATWAMMLLGFGAIGFSLRSRRGHRALAQIA